MKTAWDKELNKNINAIKRGIKNLKGMKLKIVIDRDVETMLETTVNHIYVVDRWNDKTMLKKHLFTI